MEFGLIPHEFWYQPSWIDEEKATAARKQMVADNIIYGGELLWRLDLNVAHVIYQAACHIEICVDLTLVCVEFLRACKD